MRFVVTPIDYLSANVTNPNCVDLTTSTSSLETSSSFPLIPRCRLSPRSVPPFVTKIDNEQMLVTDIGIAFDKDEDDCSVIRAGTGPRRRVIWPVLRSNYIATVKCGPWCLEPGLISHALRMLPGYFDLMGGMR